MLNKLINYISDLNPQTPKSAISLAIFISLSEVLCFNRVKIQTPLGNILPNLYGITFMGSGTGKDKIVREIQQCIPFFEDKNDICETIYNDNKDLMNIEVEKLGTKAEKARYREAHEPRLLTTAFNSATIEGLVAMREAMEEELIGHLNFKNSEFGKFLTVNSLSADQVLNYLNEAYDGDYESKIIKGNKNSKTTKGVPQTMLAFSSVSGLVDNGEASDKLKSFLNTGLSRRSFLCFPKESEFGDPVNESGNFEELGKKREITKQELREYFNACTQIVAIGEKKPYASCGSLEDFRRESKVITITSEAYELFLDYKYTCAIEAVDQDDEEIKAEVHGRYWKTLKLAGVLAFIDKQEITLDIMQGAINISDKYGDQIKEFYQEVNAGLPEKVFNFIRKNPKSSKTLIRRDSKLFGKKRDDLIYAEQVFHEVQLLCDERGLFLNTESGRGLTKYYSISKEPC